MRQEYLNSIKAGAIEGWYKYKITPSLTAAQAALESGWGTSKLAAPPYNNNFGIKAGADWTGRTASMSTQEWNGSKFVTVVDTFRAYDSINDSVEDHGVFFTSTEWRINNYRNVVGEGDYKKACYAVANAGYATDPNYATKLINIIETYNLQSWDVEAQNGNPNNEALENTKASKIVGGAISSAASQAVSSLLLSVIGDSLGVGTEKFLNKYPWAKVFYDNLGSRQWTHSTASLDATKILQTMINNGNLQQNVVFILGTNRGVTTEEIDNVVSMCGRDRNIILVDTASEVNHRNTVSNAYREASKRHENVFYANWSDYARANIATWYHADGANGTRIHMKDSGYQKHAEFIIQAVYEAANTNWVEAVSTPTEKNTERINIYDIEYDDGKYTSPKGDSSIYNKELNDQLGFRPKKAQIMWIERKYTGEEDNAADLLEAALKKMDEYSVPAAQYTVPMRYFPPEVSIGDTGYFIDHEFNPPLYIFARVLSMTTSVTNPGNDSVVIGNVIEVHPKDKADILALQKELQENREEARLEYWKIPPIVLQMISSNGLNFKTKPGELYSDLVHSTIKNPEVKNGFVDIPVHNAKKVGARISITGSIKDNYIDIVDEITNEINAPIAEEVFTGPVDPNSNPQGNVVKDITAPLDVRQLIIKQLDVRLLDSAGLNMGTTTLSVYEDSTFALKVDGLPKHINKIRILSNQNFILDDISALDMSDPVSGATDKTRLYVKAFQEDTEVTHKFKNFSWSRISSNKRLDEEWNDANKFNETNGIDLTPSDVFGNESTFVCKMFDENGKFIAATSSSVTITKEGNKNTVSDSTMPPRDPSPGDKWTAIDGDSEEEYYYVDGEWVQTSVSKKVDEAIQEAEQAKADAIKAYNDAIAEAERLVIEQDEVWQGKMDDYDEQVAQIEADVQSAQDKAAQALTDAGISTDLAQTAKDLATTAKTNADQAKVDASKAISDASAAVTNANQAKADASQAQEDAQTAITNASTALSNSNQAQEDVLTAVSDASQAKVDASQALTNANTAIADASQAKVDAGKAVTDAQTAITEAGEAVTSANTAKTNAQTALDNSTTAITNASNAITKAGQAETTANTAKTNAQTALDNAQTALTTAGSADTKAGQAIEKANAIPTTITDIIADKNLVNGTYVDTKVNDATGAWSQELVRVEGKLDGLEIGGRNYFVDRLMLDVNNYERIGSYYYYTINNLSPEEVYTVSVRENFTNDIAIGSGPNRALRINNDKTNSLGVDIIDVRLSHGIRTYERKIRANTDGQLFIVSYIPSLLDEIHNMIQIEKGNKATDWTPAPEDLYSQEEFKLFNAQYTQDVEGVTGRLTTVENGKLDGSTFQTFKQAEYQVTADNVANTMTRVDTAEGKISTHDTVISQQAGLIESKADKTVVDSLGETVSSHSTSIAQNATDIASKASSSSVDSLTGRVDTAETSIAQNATDIKSKASQTEVDTVKGTVSTHTTTIGQHATAIASKADKTVVDTLSGTVSNQGTLIYQNANDIKSKASSELVDTIKGTVDSHTTEIEQNATVIASKANTTTVNALEGRVDTAESNISQNATAITQRVTTTTYNTGLATKENNVLKQSTAPSHLNGRLWLDISVTPNILKRSTGTTWVKATPTTASEVGAYSSSQGNALAGRVTTAETNITQTSEAITSKADKSVVDTLSGTVSNQGTLISQNATAIASKADSELVDTIKGTVDTHATEIAQNATDIATKASSTSVNALTGRVNTAETAITQNAEAIESKASQTEVDDISGTVSGHTTTLSQHANQIASKAELQLVNSIKGTVDTHTTEIAQNATAIESKASSASVNTLTGRVDTAESNISQNATAISQRVTTTTYNAGIASKENAVLKQSTAPAHVNGRLWLDTSVTPNILKRSNGTTWIKATPTTAGEVGAYSQSDGAGLAGRLTTAETNISQTATAITSKADKSTVDTLVGTVSTQGTTIAQQADLIESKANQSEVDTVKGTVSDHTSTLSQHASQISARLTSSQVNSLVDGKGFATQTWANNQITTSANGIKADLTKVEGKIDGLQVGGRNLILDSGTPVESSEYMVSEYFISEDFIAGQEYTVTIKGTKSSDVNFGLWQNTGSSGRGSLKHIKDDLYQLTFTSVATTAGNERRIRIYQPPSGSASKATIEWIKLEKGNIATDWSPAPEDQLSENDFNVFKGEYEATAQNLSSRLTAVDKVGGRLETAETKISQNATAISSKANTSTVNSLTGRVSTAETNISQNATAISSKADKSVVNTIKGTVDNHTTEISQNATAIASKASTSSVNTLTGRVSTAETTISQHATAIASKASTSSVNTLTGRVSTAESNISQNATAISARLTSSQVNSLVDGKGFSTVNYVDNQINATADGFGIEMTRVEGKIDGLQVGGRNLVLNSSKLEASGLGSASGSQAEYRTINVGQSYMDLEDGEIVTVSFDLEMKILTANPKLMVYNTNRKGPIKLATAQVDNQIQGSVGETIRKRISFTTQAIILDSPTYNYNTVEFYSEYGSSNFYKISKLKVERGNKATDWTPAPEDTMMEDDFTVFKNSYNTTVSGINTELSKTAKKTDLNGMVTETTLATKNFVTAGTMTTTLSNYAQKNNVPTNTQFNTLKNSYDSMVQTIGTNGSKIAQMVMTDSLFRTTVRENLDLDGVNLIKGSNTFSAEDGMSIARYNTNYSIYDVVDNHRGDAARVLTFVNTEISSWIRFAGVINKPGTYTFSAWIRRPAGSGVTISVDLAGDSTTYKRFSVNSEWQKIVVTKEVPVVDFNSYHFVQLRLVSQYAGVYFYLSEPKLEVGDTATPYSVAPTDNAPQSQVTQLAGSWALTLKSGNDIKTQINASTDSIRLASKFIHLSGTSLIDNAVIKSAHIDTLNANKIVGNTADFNTIRAGVLTTSAVQATHILGDTALFDKLFSNVAATNRLSAREAWIKDANIISINADKITAGTIRTQIIGRNYASNTSYIETSPHRNNNHQFTQPLDLGVYTLTFYAKANAATTARVYLNDDNGLNRISGTCSPSSISISTAWTKYTVQVNVSKFDRNDYYRLFIRVYGDSTTSLISTKEFMFAKGYVAMNYLPAPEDNPTAKDLSTYGSVVIHGGNISASSIDVGKITGDTAKFISLSFESLNSNMQLSAGAIRLQNSAGDFALMNTIPEFRSQDSGGTAAIMGKGRSHYYSGSQARFYIGSNLEGLAQYGVHIAKGQTWGIYRNSDTYGGEAAKYYNTPTGWGAVQVVEELIRLGYIAGPFATGAAYIKNLNGWGSTWPVLQPGEPVMYKAAVPGNSSGVERIWTMGTSSNGSTRVYSHVHHVFEGGTTGTSDERMKHNIEPTAVNALDHIKALTFKQFNWNRDNRFEPLGLIAQHSGILRVPDEDMEGIDIQRALMLALKGIQELQEEIKQLKEIINQ